jgi:ribosomal protein S18 acetylase RimI-like enzyme
MDMWLNQIAIRTKPLAKQAVIKLQRLKLYVLLSRRLVPDYTVVHEEQQGAQDVLANNDPDGQAADKPAGKTTMCGLSRLTAVSGSKVLGGAWLRRHTTDDGSPFSGYWFVSLNVRTLYRRMGIGEAIVLRAMDQARVEGASELRLYASEDNHTAIALYAKLGFEEFCPPFMEKIQANHVMRCGSRLVFMRKDLARLE